MHLRHLFSSRLRGSLLLGSLLVASSFSTQAAEEMLRKAVGKGAYEMAYSQQENALWLATSQSRKLDKGGFYPRERPRRPDQHPQGGNNIGREIEREALKRYGF